MEVEQEMEEKPNQPTDRLMELIQGGTEGKDLQIIRHPGHDHPLVLRELLQGDDGYRDERFRVYCDGCRGPISYFSSSSSSSSAAEGGGGAFYACPNSDCWFLLHKRCAELPPKIKHPYRLDHDLTLHLFLLSSHRCDVCDSDIDGFLYRCSDCDFGVDVRCASMALCFQERISSSPSSSLRPSPSSPSPSPSPSSSSSSSSSSGVEEEREEKQNPRTERLMELTQGEMEGKDLRIIEHRSHDHPLVLRESLPGAGGCYGGGSVPVYCDGCWEPISSSSSSSSSSGVGVRGGAFYACPNSNCWFFLHKRCAELPPEIEHPSHPDHALTLSPFPLIHHKWNALLHNCEVCDSHIGGFQYRCSDCDFGVHVSCASMALRIKDRVDENNKIHKHRLIPLEKEAQFFCDFCGREHKGKSYLCPTCGFWANQICASTTTTVVLHSHPHRLTRVRSFRYVGHMCKICNEEVKRACWVYCCSEECKYWFPECKYWFHVCCLPWEEVENSNKDIQTNLHSESTSHKIDIPMYPKEDILDPWPLSNESDEVITQLIKKLSSSRRHKRVTKTLHCRYDHSLIFVNKKIDKFKDDQLCDGCAQTISSQFYHCAQCNFSLHEWCAELPNKVRHQLHPKHPLGLFTQIKDQPYLSTHCRSCDSWTNGFLFGCSTCHYYIDLKCASLPRLIKHQVHDHELALRSSTEPGYCNACGKDYDRNHSCFKCEACKFWLCINCALLPSSIRHRFDKDPFILIYSPIKDQPDDYYCEICEEDINSMYWFYHCSKCN